MKYPFLDTNIIIRFLTGDDLQKQEAATQLFAQIEQGLVTVSAPDTVIADAVFVLSSPRLYKKSHTEVQILLTPLVRLPHFRVKNRRIVLRALTLYGNTNLDFGDTMIIASMESAGEKILYSYDRDFDAVHTITRREPQRI